MSVLFPHWSRTGEELMKEREIDTLHCQSTQGLLKLLSYVPELKGLGVYAEMKQLRGIVIWSGTSFCIFG